MPVFIYKIILDYLGIVVMTQDQIGCSTVASYISLALFKSNMKFQGNYSDVFKIVDLVALLKKKFSSIELQMNCIVSIYETFSRNTLSEAFENSEIERILGLLQTAQWICEHFCAEIKAQSILSDFKNCSG